MSEAPPAAQAPPDPTAAPAQPDPTAAPAQPDPPVPTPKTLLSLHEDMLEDISRFLSLMDILKCVLICNNFDSISQRRTEKTQIVTSEFRQQFSIEENTKIFTKIGSYVQKLKINEWITPANIDFYQIIATHCSDTVQLELSYPSRCGLPIYKEVISKGANIELIRFQATEAYPGRGLQQSLNLEENLCRVINNLENLKHLKLAHLTDVTGEQLMQLTKLEELNIAHCHSFKSSSFIGICEKNTLKVLNMANCILLDNAALEKLVETQDQLKMIILSNNLAADNYEVVGSLKSLKDLFLYNYQNKKLRELIANVSENHKHDLETLEIICSQSVTNFASTNFWYHLSTLENLRTLHVPVAEGLNDYNLINISKKLKNLNRLVLTFNEYRPHELTSKSIIQFLTNSRNLRELALFPWFEIHTDMIDEIVSLRRKVNACFLTIDFGDRGVDLQMPQSRDWGDVLRIIYSRNP